MYYEYWGLKKPAFDNVPDPSMYVDCHTSMETAIAETLFAIEEGDECVAVIVGDVGLGKTMSIRMIIDSLEQERYKIVLITNPGISFVQILQEILGQLTGRQCEEKRKVNLLEAFNHELFATFAEGKKILIFIDEANAISPVNLENLRLLTNMQGDRRNLFTMVLVGQNEFAKRLEHPKRANLFQRVGAYSRIDKLDSVDKIRKYVETRLMLAGTTRKVFADDAFGMLWEQSGHGVPRLVNKLSKLCLKAGETNSFESINADIVEQIGARFHKLAGPAIQKRRPRRTGREETAAENGTPADAETGDGFSFEFPGVDERARGGAVSFSPGLRAECAAIAVVDDAGQEPRLAAQEGAEEAGCPATDGTRDFPEEPPGETREGAGEATDLAASGQEEERTLPASRAPLPEVQPEAVAEAAAEGAAVCAALPQEAPADEDTLPAFRAPLPEAQPEEAEAAAEGAAVCAALPQEAPAEESVVERDSEEEMAIGQYRIKISLPWELMKQSYSSSPEHRYKLAGGLAAETLKRNHHVIASQSVDPVPIWVEIRDFVLHRMTHERTGQPLR